MMTVDQVRSVLRTAAHACVIACMLSPCTALAQAPATPAPEPSRTWTGTGGAGLSLTSGNSDTINYNLAFDVTRDPKTRNKMNGKGLYLRGKQDDELTVNRTSLAFRDEYTLTPRTFVFGQLEYLRDTFKLIDYLVAPTGGVGYKVIATDATKLEVDAGGGVVWEKNPGEDVDTSAALTAGQTLQHKVTATATVKEGVTALWKADDFADGLYTFSAGLATQVSTHTQLSADFLDTLKNKPATAETKKNDVALVLSFAVKY